MSKPDTIKIDEVEYVRKSSSTKLADPVDGMSYCIIRCRDAGVHAGYVKKQEGREVELVRARRLWRWYGKTLNGLAIEGSFAPKKCKYGDEVPEIKVLDACEVLPCSVKGQKSIQDDVAPWKND